MVRLMGQVGTKKLIHKIPLKLMSKIWVNVKRMFFVCCYRISIPLQVYQESTRVWWMPWWRAYQAGKGHNKALRTDIETMDFFHMFFFSKLAAGGGERQSECFATQGWMLETSLVFRLRWVLQQRRGEAASDFHFLEQHQVWWFVQKGKSYNSRQ